MSLAEAEAALVKSVESMLPWNWRQLRLRVEFEDGSFSPSGTIIRLLGPSIEFASLSEKTGFSQCAFRLRNASNADTAGPVLVMQLTWNRGSSPGVTYVREADEVTSLSEVPRNVHGQMPMFMFKKELPAKLLLELKPREVVYAVQTYVSANSGKKEISEPVQDIVAVSNWLSGVCRGGSDSYFFQGPTSEGEAIAVLQSVRRGLRAQSEDELAALFDESLKVYAPEVAAVRRVCEDANLAPSSKPTSENDDDVNRITRAVQNLDLKWLERIGIAVQKNVQAYATSS